MNSPKSLSIALLASMAFNLLLAGFLAGQVLPDRWLPGPLAERPRANPGAPRPVPLGTPAWARNELDILQGAQALRERDRQLVRRIVNQRTPEVRASMQELTAKRRALLAVLDNPPADISILEVALADVTHASATAQKKGQDVVVEIAKELDVDARTTFLTAMSSLAPERRPRRNPPPGRPGPQP